MEIIVALSFLIVLGSLFLSWKNVKVLKEHQKWTNFSFWATLVSVILTELMVQLGGGVELRPLFFVHLGFAVPYLVVLSVLRWRITGKRNLRAHRPMGYAAFALYAGTFVTGMTLLLT